jgi:anti-sigma-K factor RskA
MTEEHVLELLPGYALECLDDADLLKVARHLQHCPDCTHEALAYRHTVEQIAVSEPLITPPAGLKQAVVAGIARQAAARVTPPSTSLRASSPVSNKAGWQSFFSRLFSRPLSWGVGTLGLLLAVLLGFNNLRLAQQVNDLQERFPADGVVIVKLAATDAAPGAVGYLLLFPGDNNGSLTVQDAPQLEPGYQYQLWLIHNGIRSSGGVFSVNQDGYFALQISSDQPLSNFQSFGITIEPAGGSPGPTGKKVLSGSL